MKKTIAFAAALIIGVSAFSQDSSSTRPMGGDSMNQGMQRMGGDSMGMMNHRMMKGKMKDCVMMHDGTPMVMKGGQMSAMTDAMTLSNGTMVMTDGTVKMKDGKTKMMKDGDCIYMDGTMSKMPMRDKNKMKKDSTMM